MSVLNPLRVENPMFSTVERFLSGVISTTPHAPGSIWPAPVDVPSNQEDGPTHQHHSGLCSAETVLTELAVSDMPISLV